MYCGYWHFAILGEILYCKLSWVLQYILQQYPRELAVKWYCSKYFVAISRILSKSFCKGRPPIEHLEHFGAMTGGQESAIPQRRANLTLSAPALTFAFSLHTQRSWLSAQAPIQSTAFLKTCGSTLMSVMSMAWSPVKMAQRSNEQSIAVVLEIRRVLQYVLGVSSVVAILTGSF
jgi:hypothetical protein